MIKATSAEEEFASIPVGNSTGGKKVPMTFNEVPVTDVPKYVDDEAWFFQQKVDGIRGQLVLEPGKTPWFRSKSGDKLVSTTAAKISTPLLKKLGAGLPEGAPGYIVDGEMLDGKFYVFDMVPSGSEDLPWETRMKMAETWVQQMHKSGLTQIQALPTARSADEKKALWEAVRDTGGEGVMIKRKDATYKFGQRVSTTLKAKVTSTADVVVIERNRGGKENAVIGLKKDGKVVEIGTVSMQGKEKFDKVLVGDIIEVEYLWANPDNNSLTQPRMLKRRPDKTADDATADQLRFVNKGVHDSILKSAATSDTQAMPETPEEVSSAASKATAKAAGVVQPMPYPMSPVDTSTFDTSTLKSTMLGGMMDNHRGTIALVEKGMATDPEFRKYMDTYFEQTRELAAGSTYVAVPTERIEQIIAAGRLKTMHEKGVDSVGNAGKMTGYTTARREYESRVMGIGVGNGFSKTIKPADRPIYGYVGPEPGMSGWSNLKHASKGEGPMDYVTMYGVFQFEMKPEIVGRTTVTFSDSLNSGLRPIRLADVDKATPSELLMADNPTGAYWAYVDMAKHGSNHAGGLYTEAQIHGGVDLKRDVARVHVTVLEIRADIAKREAELTSGTLNDYQTEWKTKSLAETKQTLAEIEAAMEALKGAGYDVNEV